MRLSKKFLRKHRIKLFALAFIVLLCVGFASAYFTGKKITDDVSMQWVSHTEYWNNDSASTIVRLADYRGNAYNVDSCKVTILYPDKTIFVNNLDMLQSNIAGNWYKTDSLMGEPLGTYEQEVTCMKGPTIIKSSQSFHLNPALEEVNTISNNLNFARDELSNVNLTLHAKVEETGEEINVNLNSTETSLTNLMNAIEL